MCFIICKMFFLPQCQLWKFILNSENEVVFPMTLANYIQTLRLLSAILYKQWHYISNESNLVWWVELKCCVYDAWAKMWSLNFLINVNSALFNFLPLLKTCETASGVLWAVSVSPVQDRYWQLEGVQWRATKVGSTWHARRGWVSWGFSVWRRDSLGGFSFIAFFSYPVEGDKRRQSQTPLWGTQQKGMR